MSTINDSIAEDKIVDRETHGDICVVEGSRAGEGCRSKVERGVVVVVELVRAAIVLREESLDCRDGRIARVAESHASISSFNGCRRDRYAAAVCCSSNSFQYLIIARCRIKGSTYCYSVIGAGIAHVVLTSAVYNQRLVFVNFNNTNVSLVEVGSRNVVTEIVKAERRAVTEIIHFQIIGSCQVASDSKQSRTAGIGQSLDCDCVVVHQQCCAVGNANTKIHRAGAAGYDRTCDNRLRNNVIIADSKCCGRCLCA